MTVQAVVMPEAAVPEAAMGDAATVASRLVPRVEQVGGYWVLKAEFRENLNPAEKASSMLLLPSYSCGMLVGLPCTEDKSTNTRKRWERCG